MWQPIGIMVDPQVMPHYKNSTFSAHSKVICGKTTTILSSAKKTKMNYAGDGLKGEVVVQGSVGLARLSRPL